MSGAISYRSSILALLLSLLSLFPAWADPDETAECRAPGKGGLESHWQALCSSPSKDVTLHRMRAAQAAFALGRDEIAAAQFDLVLEAIEAIYADTESAAKARSVWHSEGEKDFKGEPFERVMAYYYRGLLYLAAGDWDNAQASFKGGILQDTFAEQERFKADTASLIWLEGWARRCRGSTSAADELFAEARKIKPELTPPPPGANTLVVAESGTGPLKAHGGKQSEKLLVREGAKGPDLTTAVLGGQRDRMVEAEDLFFQATTSAGRAIDTILVEKAATKTTTETAGHAAMIAGMGTAAGATAHRDSRSNNSGAGYSSAERAVGAAGGIVMLVGLIAAASSAAMDARADIRTWDTLPHSIHLAAMTRPADTSSGVFDLLDDQGRSLLGSREAVRINIRPDCSLAWVGSGNILPPALPLPPVPTKDETGPPNCRTASGATKTVPPDICLRIGGTLLE
jgi:hypothetical protein